MAKKSKQDSAETKKIEQLKKDHWEMKDSTMTTNQIGRAHV